MPEHRRHYGYETTIAMQKQDNIHVHTEVKREDFIAMRQQRDANLKMPALMLAPIQINIRGGAFPSPEANGICYLKFPLNYFV